MRERTPLPRAVIERLPRLKLIASTGTINPSIDVAAAADFLAVRSALAGELELAGDLALSERLRYDRLTSD